MIGKKILIIEDTPELQSLESEALKKAGFEVAVADNGEEGLKHIKKGGIDLVLMDIVMPDQSGFEVLSKLKQSHTKIPVIVYSNMSEFLGHNEAIRLGAIDYFEKNITPLEAIVRKINEVFKQTDTPQITE